MCTAAPRGGIQLHLVDGVRVLVSLVSEENIARIIPANHRVIYELHVAIVFNDEHTMRCELSRWAPPNPEEMPSNFVSTMNARSIITMPSFPRTFRCARFRFGINNRLINPSSDFSSIHLKHYMRLLIIHDVKSNRFYLKLQSIYYVYRNCSWCGFFTLCIPFPNHRSRVYIIYILAEPVHASLWLSLILIIKEVNQSILVNIDSPRKHIIQFNILLGVAVAMLWN